MKIILVVYLQRCSGSRFVQGVIRWVSTKMSRRQCVRRNSVGVKEKQILLIDNISGSSRLSSNFIYWTRVLLLIELQVTQRMISEAWCFMSRSSVIVDVLSLRLWPYCLSSSCYRRWGWPHWWIDSDVDDTGVALADKMPWFVWSQVDTRGC